MAIRAFNKNEIKFVLVFMLATAILLMAILFLAILIDPHNDFGTGLFKPLVITNRTEKINYLKNILNKPQIMILGSSRVYDMDPDLIKKITGKNAYNASVSYARSEDHWAMISLFVKDFKINPETIVVGLNLGELNNDDIEPQTINNKYLTRHLNITFYQKISALYKSFKNSINQQYLRDIFVSLFKIRVDEKTDRVNFLENGKIDTPASYYSFSGTDRVADTYSRATNLFKNFDQLNPMRKLYLEKFIAFANQNNIKIKLVLLPMPDETIEKLRKDTNYSQIYSEFKSYVDGLHLAYQFYFYDFSSVDKFNGLSDSFSDSTHPGPKNIDLITKKIFERKK